jgi:hypothetical protein
MILEFSVFLTTLFSLLLGSCSMYWVKVRPSARRAWWGSCLFVIALLLLGAAIVVAALIRATGLAPLGLLSGLLIVGMLWDSSIPVITDDSSQG